MMRICYAEEDDRDFIRWTSNLLRTFLQSRSIQIVKQSEQPDLMLASIWRPHVFLDGVPVILVTNENWRFFGPHFPLSRYKAVIGLYPPNVPCNFISFPLAAVHFNMPMPELYLLRTKLLSRPKTKFCCFVTTNGNRGEYAEHRIKLFRAINAWKPVDSAGSVENNTGWLAPLGLDFLYWIAQYKYMICLENSFDPGYITEKPFQSWLASTVPIYDGGCADQLNQAAIVNAGAINILGELQRLENDPAAYAAKRQAELTDTSISLQEFEREFRRLVLETH